MAQKILRLPAVLERTGKSRSALYADIAAGTFPPPVKLSRRSVGWTEASIEAWIDKCIQSSQRKQAPRRTSGQPTAADRGD